MKQGVRMNETRCVVMLVCCLVMVCLSCRESNQQSAPNFDAVNASLQAAYARATRYARMYEKFIAPAKKERNELTAALFSVLSQSEQIRAMLHAQLLLSRGVTPLPVQEESVTVGNLHQTLKMAMSSENVEYYDLYAGALRVAETNKDTAALEQFRLARAIDEEHRELINAAFNRFEANPGVNFSLCTRCGYIFTGDRQEGCPICKKIQRPIDKV